MSWQNNLNSLTVKQVVFFSGFFLVLAIMSVLMFPFFALLSLLRFCWGVLASEYTYLFGYSWPFSAATTNNDLLTIEGDQVVYRIESRNKLDGSDWKFVKHEVGNFKDILDMWPDNSYVEYRIKRSTIWSRV